jgi:hypothetical protein
VNQLSLERGFIVDTYSVQYLLCRPLVITGVSKTLAIVDQLISGLESYGVLTAIRNHRELMEPLLTLEGAAHFSITPDLMLDHLLVDCSPDGSNKKTPELDVHKFFCDYVQEIAARKGTVSCFSQFFTLYSTDTVIMLATNILLRYLEKLLLCDLYFFPVVTFFYCLCLICFRLISTNSVLYIFILINSIS